MSARWSLARLVSNLLALPRTVSSQAASYNPDDFARLAGAGCSVVVHGNPFAQRGCDDRVFVAAVVAAMQGRSPGPPVRFRAHPSNDAAPGDRVVLLFNGSATARAADLCIDGKPQRSDAVGPDGRIRVLAVWCHGNTVLSECAGWVSGIRATTDRRFIRLVAQVTRDLFPMMVGPGGLKGH